MWRARSNLGQNGCLMFKDEEAAAFKKFKILVDSVARRLKSTLMFDLKGRRQESGEDVKDIITLGDDMA